jgi:hypothetical protein
MGNNFKKIINFINHQKGSNMVTDIMFRTRTLSIILLIFTHQT